MKTLFTILLWLIASTAHATGWTVGTASCGTAPSGSVVQQQQIGNFWFLAIQGTVGTGTVTSCTLNFQTDGTVSSTGTPSCLANDTTSGAALGVTFAATNTGTWGYGQVTLASAANMAGHKITLWCVR